MRATDHACHLQITFKKDACGQQLDIVQHCQPLFSRCPVNTAQGKCDAVELVLVVPAGDGSRRIRAGLQEAQRMFEGDSHSVQRRVDALAHDAIRGRVNK